MRKCLFVLLIISLSLISCKQKSQNAEFWEWFEKNQKEYYDFTSDNEKLARKLNFELRKIDSNLEFEVGKRNEEKGIREFIITANGNIKSFAKVKKLVKESPKLNHWKIIALRQREPGDDIIISLGNIELSYDEIYFQYSENKKTKKLSVTLFTDNFEETLDYKQAISITLDKLLGEYDRGTYVDLIDIKKNDYDVPDTVYNFVGLRKLVDRIK